MIIEKTIEVNAPLCAVYNQWTHFEDFPEFMEDVMEVQQLDDKRIHWQTKTAGRVQQWEVEIFQQEPDSLIAWRSLIGPMHAGTASFRTRGPSRTEIMIRVEYYPQGMLQSLAGSFGMIGRRIEDDLERFKQFIQNRPEETGAWRGRIHAGTVEQPPASSHAQYIQTNPGSYT
jgi:uncharacterized membrane protein